MVHLLTHPVVFWQIDETNYSFIDVFSLLAAHITNTDSVK